VIEFVAQPREGRVYSAQARVRLSDANPQGLLRFDGVARYLQDVATDDWDTTGIVSSDTWVVRRTAIRRNVKHEWPRLGEYLELRTWCGGVGAAWAERRTDILRGGQVIIETAALWVPVDPSGHPVRVRPEFFDVYGSAIRGRKVSGRVAVTPPPEGAISSPWPLRRADLDVVGHVNNAAVWQAVSEILDGTVSYVELVHHGPVESGHDVRLVTSVGELWLLVDGEVRVSAHYLDES
jgi:acyl-ACP thioesterase